MLLHALPDGAAMPPSPPPMPDPEQSNCTQIFSGACPLPFKAGYEACLACTRLARNRSHAICPPVQREAYCNTTQPAAGGAAAAAAVADDANVTCGIALSGAIELPAIAAGQVTASAASPPYMDMHGTMDKTVPYSNALGAGNHSIWGDALDTRTWLTAQAAPNYLVSIPGAGHVPFTSLPPCTAGTAPDPETGRLQGSDG